MASIKQKSKIWDEDMPRYSEYLVKNIARLFKKAIKENPSGEISIKKKNNK